MRFLSVLAGAIALTMSGQAAASPFRAEGDFTTFLSNLEWEPDCYEPSPPYSRDEYAARRYISEVEGYISCAQNQAKEDAEYAVEQIREGRDEAIQGVLDEMESLTR